MYNTQAQLDPDIVNLAKATRTVESGNDPTAKGKSGEYGYYQYEPDTWATQSKAAGVNVPLDQATPQQQNEVWYKWAEGKKAAGNNIGQIASMQNAGEGRPNAYLEGNSGTNSSGVQYDTAAYAKKVAEEYQKLKGNNIQTQSDQTRKTFAESIPNQTPPGSQPTAIGSLIRDTIKGTGIPSVIASGVNAVQAIEGKPETDTFHNKYLGNVNRVGKGFDPAKGFFGSENKENRRAVLDSAEKGVGLASTLSTGEGLLNAGKTLATKGVTGLVGGSSVLESPAVVENLKNIGLKNPVEDFKAFSNAEKVEMLTEAMKNANTVDRTVIQQALDKVLPEAIKEAGGKIAFSKAHPILAKIPSILKTLTGLGTNVGIIEAISKLNKK